MDEYNDGFENSISDQIWTSIPNFIKWLQILRKKSKHSHSINLTIILHSATLIEGLLFDMLESEMGRPVRTKRLEDRLLIELIRRLENSTWTQYIEIFELVANKKLSSFTNNQTWKGINALFHLRNMLTHGKSFELKFYKDNPKEPKITTKYSNIVNYLKEVKVINTKEKGYNPKLMSIITNESADHFYKLTDKFLGDLYKKHIKNNIPETTDSYENAFLW